MSTVLNPEVCKISGLQYFSEIPNGFRLATMKDIRKGHFRNGTAYLGKGLDGRYYCKRIRYTVPDGLIPFVESHRVYLWVGGKRTGDSQGEHGLTLKIA